MRRRCPTPPPIPPSQALTTAPRGHGRASSSGQATVEFVAVLPLLVVGGAIVLQGLVLSVALLVVQVTSESLTSQAAAGVTTPSVAKAPISARVRRRMHVRLQSDGRVAVDAPRLLPMPRLHVARDVVQVTS